LVAALASSLVACQKKKEGNGVVSLTFPARSFSVSGKASQSVGAMSLDFAKVCYLASVTGGSAGDGTIRGCSVPLGITDDRSTSFMAPGSSVELKVNKGAGYTLRIFAYLRDSSTDACPSIGSAFSTSNFSRLYEVAKQKFDMDSDDVTLNVSVTDTSTTLASQYSLPATCTASAAPVGAPILISPNGSKISLSVVEGDGVVRSSSPGNYKLTLVKDGSR
jgi:hypothetical protein